MKNSLDGVDIANDVMMSAITHKGGVVLVEGEADANLLSEFLDPSCQIKTACGKRNVIDAIEILDKRGYSKALGVVDADFWHVDGVPPPHANVLLTDHHDIEMLLLASPALQKVLRQFASADKLKVFRAKLKGSFLEWLAEQAFALGALLRVSIRNNYGLSFSELRFSKFIDRDTLSVDVSRMVVHVISKTATSCPPSAQLCTEFPHKPTSLGEALQICRGEDVVEVLSIALIKSCGSCKHEDVIRSKLVTALILAYDSRHFQKTQLYKSIKLWEAAKLTPILSF